MCADHFPLTFLRLPSYFRVPGNVCLKRYTVASVQLLELCLIHIYKLELGLRKGAVLQGFCVLLWCYGVVVLWCLVFWCLVSWCAVVVLWCLVLWCYGVMVFGVWCCGVLGKSDNL
jgi:hypothetical protein